MQQLLNKLLKNHTKPHLFQLFGINAELWRQHKAYVDTKGKSGTILSSKHYKSIKSKYQAYLNKELKNLETVNTIKFDVKKKYINFDSEYSNYTPIRLTDSNFKKYAKRGFEFVYYHKKLERIIIAEYHKKQGKCLLFGDGNEKVLISDVLELGKKKQKSNYVKKLDRKQ